MINKVEAVHSFTVMPKDCNFNKQITGHADILFSGKLQYEMDYAVGKIVRRALYEADTDSFGTASTDNSNFENPSFIGDIVKMVATIKALGKSSIQVRIKVTREDLEGKIEPICSANMTFVGLKDGKPHPHHLSFDDLVTN